MTDKVITHGVCKECKKEFDYPLSPGYPRFYCDTCKVVKKAEYDARQVSTPVAPVDRDDVQQNLTVKPGDIAKQWDEPKEPIKQNIKEPTGEYQSLVYNKTLSANSYEVGKSGNRFKLYFETVKELEAKIKELKDAGLMEDEVDFSKKDFE